MHLSIRGQSAVSNEVRSDFALFFEASNNQWDAERNPRGKFPLNMAENNLSWKDMKKKIDHVLKTKEIPDWVANYTGMGGSDSFLMAMTSFLRKYVTQCRIDPSELVCSAGATAVLELASWVLCNPGEYAVIPAPSYPVYTQDIGNKSHVIRYNLITHHDLSTVQDGPLLTSEHLEKTKGQLENQGKVFKLLILTNPDNPTGGIYSEQQLLEIAEWCIRNEVHVIINELYALSIIDIADPSIHEDYNSKGQFRSFVRQIQEKNSPFVHWVYGLSKDLGMSGFRVGMVYSKNEAFLQAYRNLNAPHLVSNPTQWVIQEVLSDEAFIKAYIAENQKRLTGAYSIVVKKVRQANIPYVPAKGSLFVWLDMSAMLTEQTDEADQRLWADIYNDTGVLLTPGQGFGHSKNGLFRLVYSFMNDEAIEEAVSRLIDYYRKKNLYPV